MYRSSGSVSWNSPCSYSVSNATLAIGFVIEYKRNIASARIGSRD
jgi:hypothetical protein